MRQWGAIAGRVIGGCLVVGAVGVAVAAAVLGIGLVWIAATWFTNLVLR